MKLVCLLLLHLVPPCLHALGGTEGRSADCGLDLQVASPTELRGVAQTDEETEISFHAVNNGSCIHSETKVTGSTKMTIQLCLTSKEGVPGLEKVIVEGAVRVAQDAACQITDKLSTVYKDLVDHLHECTGSELYASIAYHMMVVTSARRICEEAKSICTATPKSTYGNAPFVCREDLEEMFGGQLEEAQRKMEEMRLRREAAVREGRGLQVDSKCNSFLCGGLEGGSWGCCGNYDGCCWFCDALCYLHDMLCKCCDRPPWICGPMCVRNAECPPEN